MAYSENINVPRKWEECPRDPDVAPRWQSLYVTLKPNGEIILGRVTHKAMGSPMGYVLMYERDRYVIGLKGGNPDSNSKAYPARERGRHGARRVFASRLLAEYGLNIPVTIRFPRAQKDRNGILILDLRDVVPAARKKRSVR